MAHKNREVQNFIFDITLRLRIRLSREKARSISKWIVPLLASLLIKLVSHFLIHL